MPLGTIRKLDLSPPEVHIFPESGLLDRKVFHKTIPVLAARVPAAKTGRLLKAEPLKRSVLDIPKISNVLQDGSDRLVLLDVATISELSLDAKQFLEQEGAQVLRHDLHLHYDFWTADDILQAILPEELRSESPTGFAVTGHLAHLNLNKEYLPYKHIIGQVIIDKNKRIRTVVNKLDNIHNQFRFFDMELIAGQPDFLVKHHESDCWFTFDFREVYWNSRLHTEHERLVRLFKPEQGVVADVFAGVGPFAVPAAKKGCAILANDLNPNSAKWLRRNVEDNQVMENVRVFCEDGRDFIKFAILRVLDEPFPAYTGPKPSRRQQREQRRLRQDGPAQAETANEISASVQVRDAVETAVGRSRNWISHFVMNLPDTATTFLDAFRGVMSQAGRERDLTGVYEEMPMIHCHCFTRFLERKEAEADINQRVEEALGVSPSEDVSFHLVRSVAPNKDMYCISFRLPRDVAFA